MDPAGVFATSYQRDQALIRTRKQLVALIVFLIALLLVLLERYRAQFSAVPAEAP